MLDLFSKMNCVLVLTLCKLHSFEFYDSNKIIEAGSSKKPPVDDIFYEFDDYDPDVLDLGPDDVKRTLLELLGKVTTDRSKVEDNYSRRSTLQDIIIDPKTRPTQGLSPNINFKEEKRRNNPNAYIMEDFETTTSVIMTLKITTRGLEYKISTNTDPTVKYVDKTEVTGREADFHYDVDDNDNIILREDTTIESESTSLQSEVTTNLQPDDTTILLSDVTTTEKAASFGSDTTFKPDVSTMESDHITTLTSDNTVTLILNDTSNFKSDNATAIETDTTDTIEVNISTQLTTVQTSVQTTTSKKTIITTIEDKTSKGLATPAGPGLDIPALLKIISDLVYYYDTNLTLWVNETLQHRKIPTCKTLDGGGQSLDYDVNTTRDNELVAKCFVCGLVERGIPRSAPCADAFSGDFIPLVPVDPTAKANLARFRKYCKYKNVWGVYFNRSDKKAIYGRWTGGCSVRWTDLSGVYTQRACRNRNRAHAGRHYASKRMAKLEMALRDKESGCIISPMAVLTPLSRGVSLYARYHVCVCTGSWCNSEVTNNPTTAMICLLLYFRAFLQKK